jgi:hypothetical protein
VYAMQALAVSHTHTQIDTQIDTRTHTHTQIDTHTDRHTQTDVGVCVRIAAVT